MTTQQTHDTEVIIRFSHTWWIYMFARGGMLRAMVNGLEDTLAITGRTLLLIFLLYCGVKSGALLVKPDWSPSIWLEMGMFVLQLAGLEGSIPGLARHADTLHRQGNHEEAKKVEKEMKSARIMTILTIGEGVLHLFGIPTDILRIISGVLLLVRGVVITSFLMELAKIDAKGPRVLSRSEHTSEEQARLVEGEQAHVIAGLQEQVQQAQKMKDDSAARLATAEKQARIASDLHTRTDQANQSQARLLTDLQAHLTRVDQEKHHLTALLEGAQTQVATLTTHLESAQMHIVDLSNTVETANGRMAHLQEQVQRVEQEKDDGGVHLAAAEKQIRIVTDLHIQTDQINQNQARLLADLQTQLSQSDQTKGNLGVSLKTADLHIADLTAQLETAHMQIAELHNAESETAKMREDYHDLTATLETAHLQIAELTAKLDRAKNKIADLHHSGEGAQPGKPRSSTVAGQPADQSKITSIDQARAKYEGGSQGRTKISHTEVVAFMAAHPHLKRAEVAEQLEISERKVYDAIAWQREQENAPAAHSSL